MVWRGHWGQRVTVGHELTPVTSPGHRKVTLADTQIEGNKNSRRDDFSESKTTTGVEECPFLHFKGLHYLIGVNWLTKLVFTASYFKGHE